ncbi:MAG: Cys-tRNA(Pro) deacylase [Erysipelotrichaceae bacterium]|nr:Cys-tRNA(Pro) deacylase [Erysipelotrichaceae bacterium]
MKAIKTNVMRLLDRDRIPYQSYEYGNGEPLSGEEVARLINRSVDQVFKTLVTVGHSRRNYVFVIPVNHELDLKKAAAAVGEKSIEMIKAKELLPLTGYVHGGCSPIGMKKFFTTTVDSSAEQQNTIIFSAGRIGYQVEMTLDDLHKMIEFQLADVCG